jgi:hypothetical protein
LFIVTPARFSGDWLGVLLGPLGAFGRHLGKFL